MAQGPTNVNLIATFIYNNPGCRRVDIKRMLHKAATGEDATRRNQLDCKNQYFQNYGNASNVYLGKLWYNKHINMVYQESGTYDYWDRGKDVNRPGKSSYHLTWEGEDKVFSKDRLIRPFKTGQLVEWQWQSPRRHGWCHIHYQSMRGLVIDRNETYGLWVLTLDGKQQFLSHQAWIRRIDD